MFHKLCTVVIYKCFLSLNFNIFYFSKYVKYVILITSSYHFVCLRHGSPALRHNPRNLTKFNSWIFLHCYPPNVRRKQNVRRDQLFSIRFLHWYHLGDRGCFNGTYGRRCVHTILVHIKGWTGRSNTWYNNRC